MKKKKKGKCNQRTNLNKKKEANIQKEIKREREKKN